MITVLLSHERSGSHLVGDYLRIHPGLQLYDEVCNVSSVDPVTSTASFHRFQVEWVQKNKEAYFKSSALDRLSFVNEYFQMLTTHAGGADICVDIKYGHLHNFDWFWNPLFRRPILFEAAEKHGYRIIHLHRNNVVEATVSALIADQRKVWHSWQLNDDKTDHGEDKDSVSFRTVTSSFELPPWRVAREADLLRQQTKWITSNWIHNVECLEILYEDFVESMNGNQLVLAELSKFIEKEVPGGRWAPRLKKLGKPMEQTISNFSEVKEACAKSGLSEFI